MDTHELGACWRVLGQHTTPSGIRHGSTSRAGGHRQPRAVCKYWARTWLVLGSRLSKDHAATCSSISPIVVCATAVARLWTFLCLCSDVRVDSSPQCLVQQWVHALRILEAFGYFAHIFFVMVFSCPEVVPTPLSGEVCAELLQLLAPGGPH